MAYLLLILRDRTIFIKQLLIALVVCISGFQVSMPAYCADVFYVYDDAGRVVGAYTPTGDINSYQYDAVGNLTNVQTTIGNSLKIFNFSPAKGRALDIVKITGKGFTASGGMPVVKFTGTTSMLTASIISSTDTEALVAVPSGVVTGVISVTKGANSTTSLSAFTVDYQYAIDPADGVHRPYSITQAGDITDIRFNATVGHYMGIQLKNINFSPSNGTLSVKVLKPDGTVWLTQALVANSATVDIPFTSPIPTTGLYRLQLVPSSTVTGSASVAIWKNLTGVLGVTGSATLANLVYPNQRTRYTYTGVLNKALSIALVNRDLNLTAATTDLKIYKPDGTLFYSKIGIVEHSKSYALPPLPVAGVYTFEITNSSSATGIMEVWLSQDLLITALNPNISVSAPLSVGVTRRGQHVRTSFDAVAGHKKIVLELRNVVKTYSAGVGVGFQYVGYIYVYKPDGALYNNYNITDPYVYTIQFPDLVDSGQYSVVIELAQSATGTFDINYTAPMQQPIVINAVPANINLINQRDGIYTFNGIAGGNITVGIYDRIIATVQTLTLYKPDGTQLYSGNLGATLSNGYVMPTLPITGSYWFYLTHGLGTQNDVLKLAVSTDYIAPLLTLNATSPTMAITRRGQNMVIPFDLPANVSNREITIESLFAGEEGGANGILSITIKRPNGTTLTSLSILGSAGVVRYFIPSQAVAGTYTINIDPHLANTAQIKTTYAEQSAGSLTVDGAPTLFTTSLPGQQGKFTFNATAGQNLGLGVSAVTFGTPSTGVATVKVYKPDGTLWKNTSVANAATVGLPLTAVPMSGNYSVLVEFPLPTIGTMTMTLSSDITGALSPNSSQLTNISTMRFGQNLRYTFPATVGQTGVTINISNLVTSGAGTRVLSVYSPANALLSSKSFTGNFAEIVLASISATGNYTVVFTPALGAQYAGDFAVFNLPKSGSTLDPDVPPLLSTQNIPSQDVSHDLNLVAGQNLDLGIHDLVFTVPPITGQYLNIKILKPDGTIWKSLNSYFNSNGKINGIDMSAVPVTGVYKLVLDWPSSTFGSVQLSLSNNLAVPITYANTVPTNINITRYGQKEKSSFTLSSTTPVIKFNLTGHVSSPGIVASTFKLVNSSGTILSTFTVPTTTSNYTYTKTSSTPAGVYYLLYIPGGGNLSQANLTVTP